MKKIMILLLIVSTPAYAQIIQGKQLTPTELLHYVTVKGNAPQKERHRKNGAKSCPVGSKTNPFTFVASVLCGFAFLIVTACGITIIPGLYMERRFHKNPFRDCGTPRRARPHRPFFESWNHTTVSRKYDSAGGY